MFENVHFIIPARKNSKGFPGKNRELFKYTADCIFDSNNNAAVEVTSDDAFIIDKAGDYGFFTINRSDKLSGDKISIKMVIQDVISSFNNSYGINDDIILLYLTYPERKWRDIDKIYSFYKQNNLKSLITAIKPESHPYLCYAKKHGGYKKIIKHSLFRRQDYPECREICHFMCIFNKSIFKKLNNQLICNETWFYDINRPIDVDMEDDFVDFLIKKGDEDELSLFYSRYRNKSQF